MKYKIYLSDHPADMDMNSYSYCGVNPGHFPTTEELIEVEVDVPEPKEED
jgi:hypothetical protein